MYFADDQAMITQIIVPRHYTRVAVIQDNTPGGLSNLPYMQGQAAKYGYQIVASQIVNPGSTNDTPQVLNLLKANPQVIVLGLTPGPDTITFLKSMRAQNATIPIGECFRVRDHPVRQRGGRCGNHVGHLPDRDA